MTALLIDSLPEFSEKIVFWQKLHGRNHLPWQQTRDPYCVWLSEIMLQQTQVKTILDYYPRFLNQFPNVFSLATAPEDDVLALWSGLGYYSRARNLHRCAKIIVQEYGGIFPATALLLAKLPGIGRSTAGAIAGFCFSERVPILDANVRRVLTRYLGFNADISVVANERLLWCHAESLLPNNNLGDMMPHYTQGLMDLGAMVCLPRKPVCEQCPLHLKCTAFQQGTPERYPIKTRKILRKSEEWWLLLLHNNAGCVWLQKRPPSGIWAGLYCLPVFSEYKDLLNHTITPCTTKITKLPPLTHILTHRDLYLHPVSMQANRGIQAREIQATISPTGIDSDNKAGGWFGSAQWPNMGLPAPVRKLLEQIESIPSANQAVHQLRLI